MKYYPKRQPAVRSERTKRIIAMIHEGSPPREIAAAVGCWPTDVYAVCRKHSLPFNRKPGRSSQKGKEIRRTIVDAMESGYTPAEIVALVSLAWPLVKRIYDEEVRDRDGLPREETPPVPRPPRDPGSPPLPGDAGH